MSLELLKDGEWVPVTEIGKRKGYIRAQFEDGSSKWIDLSTSQIRGEEAAAPAPPVVTTSLPTPPQVEPTMAAAEEPLEVDPSIGEDFAAVTRDLNYLQQGAFFLNAYWREYESIKEDIWNWGKQMGDLDGKGDEGMCLDEVKARQFLQANDMAMARQAYLDAMRRIDVNNDRKMSLIEFLMYRFDLTPLDLLNRPQDGITDELEDALQGLVDAEAALVDLEAQKAALEEVASGTGVKAMQARTKLPNFKKRDVEDAVHAIDKAQRRITKARKSPELREKGTEWMMARGGEHARPKKAAKASTMMDHHTEEQAGLHEKVHADWEDELLLVIRQYNYKQQAGFFLNAYWDEVGETAEVLWDYAASMGECDTKNGEKGSCLDETKCAQFFRANDEDFDMSATQLRQHLRAEVCLNNDKKMSLVEYLLNQYGLDAEDLMTRPQNGHSDTIRTCTKQITAKEQEIVTWQDKIAVMEEKAAGSGVKANAAKNQIAQGYGVNQTDTLQREIETLTKQLTRAQNTDEILEPGYVWVMERQERWNAANPTHF